MERAFEKISKTQIAMCGIFGTINYKVAAPDMILDRLRHRGPDEQNHVSFGKVDLYHTRLAIQDLSPAGRQPMSHNGVHITFNGEIYNHLELREKYGIKHPSRSDTMTILLLYERLGINMLEEFDGMFALGLYDTTQGKLYLARDRAGKKPLFLWSRGDRFAFSSELNVLAHLVRPSINPEAISDFLYLGYHYREQTPYEGVTEIGGGMVVEINLESYGVKRRQWFDMAACYQRSSALSNEEALAQLDWKLHQAVKRRIDSSDLEVGAFLSGGIDSGLITAIASEYKTNLRTFTVRMPGAYDESALAQTVVERYRTRHETIDLSFDHIREDLVGILSNYGEPFFDSSAIPSYYVAQAARPHITVVLNGDGADELFGGYRRYVPFTYFDFFNKGNMAGGAARLLSRILPPAHEKKSSYNYLYRLIQLAGYERPVDVYNAATTDLFAGFSDAFVQPPGLRGISRMLAGITEMPVSPLKKILLADFNALLFSDLLPKMDIATMAHSLEGRSPFLSKELMEFAPSLPDHLKIQKGMTKFLLRTLAQQYLPAELTAQPKRGFEIPLKQWMDGELKEMTMDYLTGSAGAVFPEYIRVGFVRNLLAKKVAVSDEKRAKMLFALLALEIWHRHVATPIQGKPVAAAGICYPE